MEQLTVITRKPTFTEAEEALHNIKQVEVVCKPSSLPAEFANFIRNFTNRKRKHNTILIKSSPYFMAMVMYYCKLHKIQCNAYTF